MVLEVSIALPFGGHERVCASVGFGVFDAEDPAVFFKECGQRFGTWINVDGFVD
ncbi:hypothetical protein D3C85_1943640 [compost metagenome]